MIATSREPLGVDGELAYQVVTSLPSDSHHTPQGAEIEARAAHDSRVTSWFPPTLGIHWRLGSDASVTLRGDEVRTPHPGFSDASRRNSRGTTRRWGWASRCRKPCRPR